MYVLIHEYPHSISKIKRKINSTKQFSDISMYSYYIFMKLNKIPCGHLGSGAYKRHYKDNYLQGKVIYVFFDLRWKSIAPVIAPGLY